MSSLYRSSILIIIAGFGFFACNSNHDQTSNQTNQANQPAATASTVSEFQEFTAKFKSKPLPLALPGNVDADSAKELDKKYIKDILNSTFSPAFGSEDVLPGIADNMDAAKYFSCGSVKLDSFTGYIIHKEGEDDYYFLCLFDKSGKFTDGMCIAFKEGSNDDGTIRESSINDDGSIEISQHNMTSGKRDPEGAERHFYEITNEGKIRDLKNNASPSHA